MTDSKKLWPVLFLREQRCCHVTYWDKWELKMIEAKTSKEAKKKAKESAEWEWADNVYVMSPDAKKVLHKTGE